MKSEHNKLLEILINFLKLKAKKWAIEIFFPAIKIKKNLEKFTNQVSELPTSTIWQQISSLRKVGSKLNKEVQIKMLIKILSDLWEYLNPRKAISVS